MGDSQMGYTAVVDYGVGNLFSLTSSLKALQAEVIISADPDTLSAADRILLPGVGAFGDAVEKLKQVELFFPLRELAAKGKPFLGICLGMQLLFEKSYEYGEHEGLALLKGSILPMEVEPEVRKEKLKVPHMGWNSLNYTERNCPLVKDIEEGAFVYFVHSYYAADCEESLYAWADYGVRVPAVVGKDNVFGCQFHPEKSGTVGLKILDNFLKL